VSSRIRAPPQCTLSADPGTGICNKLPEMRELMPRNGPNTHVDLVAKDDRVAHVDKFDVVDLAEPVDKVQRAPQFTTS
jgi:hypothetical protein